MPMIELLKKLKLQLLVLQLKLRVLLLREKLTIPDLPKPKALVIHHVGGSGNFAQVNVYHKRKWGFKSSLGYYIGYHYFIGVLGKITQGRADNEEGAHCVEKARPGYWNKNSVGICLQGNLDEQEPTIEQLNALKRLLTRLKAKYKIGSKSVYLHKQISSTVCPGKKLIARLKVGLAI